MALHADEFNRLNILIISSFAFKMMSIKNNVQHNQFK